MILPVLTSSRKCCYRPSFMISAMDFLPVFLSLYMMVLFSIPSGNSGGFGCAAYTAEHVAAQQQHHHGKTLPDTSLSSTTHLSSSSTTEETLNKILPSASFFPSILPPPSDIDEMNKILESIQSEYQDELTNGFQTFGIMNTRATNGSTYHNNDTGSSTSGSILDESFENDNFLNKIWSTTAEDDSSEFRSFDVGVGNAGPDEVSVKNGNLIYQTQHLIVSHQECDALIREAKDVLSSEATIMQEQQQQQHTNATTSPIKTNYELGEVRVSQSLQTRQWLQKVLHSRLFPMLSSRFGIPLEDITLQDGLIIGYGYQSPTLGSKAQPIHRDSCLLSINIALSSLDDYTNGGTYFEGIVIHNDDGTNEQYHGGTIQTERGHALCHLGGIPHAGRSIGANGERWVLVLFCIVRNFPEYARRCHANGMILQQQEEQFDRAKLTYQAGLSFVPNDHLLLTSLGRVYIDNEQNAVLARNCLALAAHGYRHCIKANLALGRMMLSNRRPRGALRRFDRVLQFLQDRDLNNDDVWEPYRDMGYDARYYGAQAAIISAREAKRQESEKCCTFAWRKHVEVAIDRCHIALRSTPDDARLHGMLSFAENLLNS